MIVRLSNPGNVDEEEWTVVEFQGEIVGELMGPMGQISVSGKTAVMEIGQHILDGDVVVLKQPLLVVEKAGSGGGVALAGVVRVKVVFSSRPKQKKLV